MIALDNTPTIKWFTGADYGTDDSPVREWVWEEFLALGTVAELDGKVKLAGKTTFCHHLARSVVEGEAFLDRPTLQGSVVYLTEEGRGTFTASMKANGLDGLADFRVFSKRENPGVSWEQLVARARQTIIETESVLLIVDTLGKLAGFKDDDENSAGKVMTALTPLQELSSELNVAVLVTRHDRRAGGDVSESGRPLCQHAARQGSDLK
jgi:RecA-family ATPase